MLQEARDLQENAVKELIELAENGLKREITFKAPTGSGKTFMMAKFMDKMLSKKKDIVFLVTSLAKGNLAYQNYKKFNDYKNKGFFRNIEPDIISSDSGGEGKPGINTDKNVYVLPISLLAKSGKLIKDATIKNFFEYMTKSITNKNRKRIYLIKDECHIATNTLNKYSFDYFDKVFNFSATPSQKKGQIPDVEIKEEDAINASLIKRIELKKENYNLQEAIDKFKKIKQNYNNKIGVNPCLIIQISNEVKGNREIDEIIPQLNKAGLKWVLMLGDRNETNDYFNVGKLNKNRWKDYIKNDESNIEVVIFKLTISEGFDIPRACMLYQIRDVKSKQLDEQVVGRVRRNPRLLDFETLDEDAKELAMTCYVWGDIEKSSTKEVMVKNYLDVENEIRIKTTRLKNLRKSKNFNLESIIKKKNLDHHSMNIFEVYKNLQNKTNDIISMCNDYTKSYNDWFNFNRCIDEIVSNYNKQICDYEKNMETTKDQNGNEILVSLPKMSSYAYVKDNRVGITNWVWKNMDEDTDFAFDSEAERKWAEKLKDLMPYSRDGYNGSERIGKAGNKLSSFDEYYWGKNFIQNSEIKYEYYLDGKHFSYPDFIMKDSFDNIHIFEVKSINNAKDKMIDKKKYDDKISELKKCYTKASKITDNIFYLPLLEKNNWAIWRYKKGSEKAMTFDEFKKSLINNE